MDVIANARNLEEIRCAFNGITTAINRSTDIQRRLCTETVIETATRKTLSLQKIKPGFPLIGHWKFEESVAIPLKLNGINSMGIIRSDTAMLTINEFIVLLSSSRKRTKVMISTFPTKLQIKILERRINLPVFKEDESTELAQFS